MLITEHKSCEEANWQISLNQPGWANCSLGRYLNGLWRKSSGFQGGIDHVTKGKCCIPLQEYQDETSVCQTVNWKTSLSRSVYKKNHICSSGPVIRAANNFSFLTGRMSDQVSSLVGQNRNVVGRFFEIIISYHYLPIIW